MFIISWRNALCIILLLLPVLVGWPLYTALIKFTSNKYQKKKAATLAIANESIGNIKTVKSFSSEEFTKTYYTIYNDECYHIGKA